MRGLKPAFRIVQFGRFILPAIAAVLAGNACAADAPHPGQATYLKYCATCHGVDQRGGNAKTLFDDTWQYGSQKDNITVNVSYGIAQVGMPGYRRVLPDAQLNAVVDFILAMQGKTLATAVAAQDNRQTTAVQTLDYVVKVDHWIPKEAGLKTPWAIDFIDARTALITERTGGVRMVVDGKLDPKPIANTPKVLSAGQGGMLDVAVDPKYKENGWIYLGYSHALRDDSKTPAMTRIVRGKIIDHTWSGEQAVFEARPETYKTTRHHYGTRIVFDREGNLYFSIGERGSADNAQNVGLPNGKIHRVRPDGSIPRDNPFAGREGALPSVFSYGHRNPQGLAIHPATGQVWAVEHGPRGGDEVNLIQPGKNYGWPVITYGIDYDGTTITDERARPGMEQPVYYWKPSIAVCGLDFYRGEMFPQWKNHLIASALRFEEMRLLDVKENRVLHDEVILKGMGRVREAVTGPDGAIYAVMNEPDEILRLSSLGPTKY